MLTQGSQTRVGLSYNRCFAAGWMINIPPTSITPGPKARRLALGLALAAATQQKLKQLWPAFSISGKPEVR